MTPLPSSSLEPTSEVDVETITVALNRKLKSQAILASVKIDPEIEIYLSGLSIPNPQQMANLVKQILGKLQIPAQTVKVFGRQTDATAPSWDRDVWIEPIEAVDVNRAPHAEPAIDSPQATLRDRSQIPPVSCPDNNMTLAILATFLGILPLGLVAISYASQVNYKHAAGDNIGATNFANNSKRLSVISLSISGALTGLIFLAIILPVFLGGGFRNKIKQEKIAQKYTQTIMKAKMEELAMANANNNNAGISTTLTPVPPQDSEYQFKGEILGDMSGRNNFMLTATPTSGNLRSFTGVVYTISNGSTWFVKTDGCTSKSNSFFPPVATLSGGKVACDATSTLASEQSE
jgi:Interferon-induced transmembrane protein